MYELQKFGNFKKRRKHFVLAKLKQFGSWQFSWRQNEILLRRSVPRLLSDCRLSDGGILVFMRCRTGP
jgi:hypothetical protein